MNKRQMVNFFSENIIPFVICYMAIEVICKEVNAGKDDMQICINIFLTLFLTGVVCLLDYILMSAEIYGIYILANMFIAPIMAGVKNGIENSWQNTTYEMFTFLLFVAIFLLIAMGKIWGKRYEFFKNN